MVQDGRSPWWQHEAALAWALILFPPAGIYLMWKHAAWRRRFKWTWTFAAPLLWLLVVSAAFGGDAREQGPPGERTGETISASPTSQSPTASPTPFLSAASASPTPASSSSEEEARESSVTPSAEVEGVAPLAGAVQGLLYVYFFDVSLGDAIYIRTPSGEDVVIDGGDSRNELSAFLDALGETAIDVVVASHPHADHIGGLPRVVQERQVGAVWTNGQTYTTNLYRDLEAAIVSSGASKQVGTPGASFTVGAVSFTVLAPARIGSNINDNSLVLRMDCGESSFLFTGDAETSSENEMILLGRNLDVDVLKLGHHGSRTSTSSQLILAATPRLAIYQAEVDNQYGHPHRETLDRLAAAGVPVFGTGMVGETVVVSTACDDQFSVSPHFDGFPDVPQVDRAPEEPSIATAVPVEPTSIVVAPTSAPSPAPSTPIPPTQPPRDPAAYLGSSNPPPDFCNFAPCIASFWDGVGYVIQCRDGLYSKSGGRQGACSSHGGVLR